MSNANVPPNPQRGEVWRVKFFPKVGHEVEKVRPAVVVGEPVLGGLQLRIVVPVFTDRKHHEKMVWYVPMPKSAKNGLDHNGEIDASQIKSLSVDRFKDRMGVVSSAQLDDVLDAIVLCLGYEPPDLRERRKGL
jgi:mRNA interferase MazF